MSAEDLEDATFVSTSVAGRDLVPGSTIRVAFEGDSMAVAAGCNTMTGAWELVDGTLAWTGDPAQTMMACEPALSDQDTWLLGLFTDGLAASESEDVASCSRLATSASSSTRSSRWTPCGVVGVVG